MAAVMREANRIPGPMSDTDSLSCTGRSHPLSSNHQVPRTYFLTQGPRSGRFTQACKGGQAWSRPEMVAQLHTNRPICVAGTAAVEETSQNRASVFLRAALQRWCVGFIEATFRHSLGPGFAGNR
jgi:hypothetical protein